MSQGRKRSRKSKLEVRSDYCDYELGTVTTVTEKNDETAPPPVQIQSKPVIVAKLEFPPAFDHDYCKPGYQTYRPIFNAPKSYDSILQQEQAPTNSLVVSVKVKVEELDTKETSIFPIKKPVSIQRKMEPIPKNNQPTIRMCKYDPETLFKVSEEIVSESTNPADKILDIEMRNLWGNVLNTPAVLGPYEAMVQKILEAWQSWYSTSRLVRDSPLFYQCHICNLAWWSLQPFREHLETHNLETLKVTLKENIHECMIIASEQTVSKFLFIHIDGDCWKCGNDIMFHKDNTQAYTCTRCKRSLYTCNALSDHESTCMYSNISNFNIAQERQCSICKRFLNSLADVEKHMVLSHSVRSDIPIPVTYKQCMHCKCKYFKYSSHNCTKSSKNSSCNHCCRKFATKPLAAIHMLSQYNRAALCKVCASPMKARCMEMEHLLLEHSDKYQLAYKCTICSDQHILFIDEMSVKLHKSLCHKKKSDKRRAFYELLPVPKHCLEAGGVEESFQAGTESTELPPRTRKKNKTDEYFCIQNTSSEPQLRILTADVNVTVDEVDIKREPIEYSENGEIDYEEMLHNMFNKSDESTSKKVLTEETEVDKKIEDFGYVKIKTETIDDIDIIDNPIDTVKIKTEPIDEYFESLNNTEIKQDEIKNVNQNYVETLTVKVEPGISVDDIESENIVIKNEIEDDISTEVIPFDQLITDLSDIKSKDMDWVTDEVLNPDEMTFNVMNPSGLYKKKKVYACHKCGYTAQHKQYKVHVSSKCSVSPGINDSHPCTKCGLTFVMFRNYVLHFDTHGYEVMSCPKCGLKFETLVKLLSHVQKHIKNNYVGIHVLNKGGEETTKSKKKVKCHICRDVIPQADMFPHWEAHLTLKDISAKPVPIKEEPPELTVDCERVTMNNKTLEPVALRLAIEHLQSTLATEKECVICYRAFARRYDVKRHIVEHLLMDAHMNKLKNNAFRCQICSSDFRSPEQYKFHMREHGSMPIFKCELCDKTFSDSSNFAKHKKTHNVRVLICDLCRKKFHSRAALQKHISDHSVLGVTQCTFCDATFVSKQAYKRHKYKFHVKNKYKCVLCELSFTSLQRKWEHNWEVHKERKQQADCPICFKSFRKFQDVRVHARSEHRAEVQREKPETRRQKVECPICLKSFRKFKDVRAHARSEHRSDVRQVARGARGARGDVLLYRVNDLDEPADRSSEQ